jgi:hypothetical protein
VHADGTRAGRRVRASDAARGPAAVSGSRLVFRDSSGVLQLRRHGHTTRIGRGSLVALSGTWVLIRRRGHFVLCDLVTGGRTDETARRSAVAAALWGRYLSYAHANGSVWRVDISRPDATPRRLVAGTGHPVRSVAVYSWGNETAWAIRPARDAPWQSGWRDGWHHFRGQLAGMRVFGASAGGAIAGAPRRAHFRLLSWRTVNRRAALPGSGAVPSVDANAVAWLRHGRPTIATLPTHVHNRPRALDLPSVQQRVHAGDTWRLDLPTSAPLTSCSVTVRGEGTARMLHCRRPDRRRGEVLVRWPTGSKARGHYTWTVSAAGRGGTLLGTAGGEHTFRGSVTVR